MEERLRTRRVRELRWQEVPVETALAHLRALLGVGVYMSPRAQAELPTPAPTVSVSVDDISIFHVLELVASALGLAWEPRDGLVRLCTLEEATSYNRLRYYDLNGIVGSEPLPHSSGPNLPVPAAAEPEPSPSSLGGDLLARSIRLLIDSHVWAREGASIEARTPVLIVRAPPATLERIQSFLAALEPELPGPR